MVRKLLLCGLVTATTALPLVPANASAPHAPAHLPVRWQAPSATTLNEPALAANRVVTTADNVATARGLFHGHVLWRKTIPDQDGFHISLGSPTASGDQVDAVMDAAGGEGVAEFAVADGTPTLDGPTFHQLVGQLVVNRFTSTRLSGSYGSGVGPFFELGLGGHDWYVNYGGSAGLPALAGTRAFVPVQGSIQAYDPAQGCSLLPIPNPPPNLCSPTWHTALAGGAIAAVGAGPNRVVASDAAGVVTGLRATTGVVLWATPPFATTVGPPASANGIAYVGGADGVLRALDASNGAVLWHGNAGAAIRTAPTVSNGRVFVATDNGRLVEFNAAGCGHATCAPLAVGTAGLPGTTAAGRPLVHNGVAVVAYGTHLIAFTVN